MLTFWPGAAAVNVWEANAGQEYQDAVLGSAPRVAVEAAVRFGWDRWLGPRGAFIGMEGFGASAPAEALFPHFGITPEKVASMAAAAKKMARPDAAAATVDIIEELKRTA